MQTVTFQFVTNTTYGNNEPTRQLYLISVETMLLQRNVSQCDIIDYVVEICFQFD